MSDNFIINENKIRAVSSFIRNYTVAFWQITPGEEERIGSGVCIEIGSRLFVATAAHNFNSIKRGGKSIPFPANGSTDNPLRVIAYKYGESDTPGVPDLGWIEIDPSFPATTGLTGISLALIEPYHNPIADGDYEVIGMVGLMNQITFTGDHRNIAINLVVYNTSPREKPNPADADLYFDYGKSALSSRGLVQMPHPGGMSGGGIWLIPPDDPTRLWSTGDFRLVGITTHFLDVSRRIRCSPMQEWLKILQTDCPELSQYIEPRLTPSS